MKTVILASLILSTLAQATATEYVKPDGSLSLIADGSGIEFSINAATKYATGICNMDGSAQSIGIG